MKIQRVNSPYLHKFRVESTEIHSMGRIAGYGCYINHSLILIRHRRTATKSVTVALWATFCCGCGCVCPEPEKKHSLFLS